MVHSKKTTLRPHIFDESFTHKLTYSTRRQRFIQIWNDNQSAKKESLSNTNQAQLVIEKIEFGSGLRFSIRMTTEAGISDRGQTGVVGCEGHSCWCK